jgi:hypothetical protein
VVAGRLPGAEEAGRHEPQDGAVAVADDLRDLRNGELGRRILRRARRGAARLDGCFEPEAAVLEEDGFRELGELLDPGARSSRKRSSFFASRL